MKKCLLGLLALFSGLSVFAQPVNTHFDSDIETLVTGQVQFPGKQTLPKGARLFDAVLRAQVLKDAYILGATWFTQSEQLPQSKLKLGILFDLEQLILEARTNGRVERAALGLRIKEQIEQTSVTGRRFVTLDPVRLELERQHNRPLSQGDTLIYPRKPTSIRIVGALQNDCHLQFVGLRAATDYLRDCIPHPEADPDWLWIIQPDGVIQRIGVGSWNKTPPQPLAPGATLFVPFRDREAFSTEILNAELARFISTQPMLGISTSP